MMEENIFSAECKPLTLDAYRQHLSFGIVYVEKARSSFATAELLRQADAAMYQQKRQYKEQLPLQ